MRQYGTDRRVLQFASYRDGVKGFPNRLNPAHDADAVLLADFRFDGSRGYEQPGSAAAEGLEQTAVLNFSPYLRFDSFVMKPLIQ